MTFRAHAKDVYLRATRIKTFPEVVNPRKLIGGGGQGRSKESFYRGEEEREELPQLPQSLIFSLLRMSDIRLESQKFGETLIIPVELLHNQKLPHNMQSLVQD